MAANRILAFSSSRAAYSGYLEMPFPYIKDFVGNKKANLAFIPFASVDNDHNEYTSMVKKAMDGLPFLINTVTPGNAKEAIERADIIMVGGGNTFKLLHDIYECKLLDIIRDKINNGAGYIGWSAGSNITGPTIGTTNDMPVIEPESFNALGLFPFQINPHYTNIKPRDHHGETRDQRLEEFIKLNPGVPVIGLPEATGVKLENGLLTFIGQRPGVLFYTEEGQVQILKREININEDISFLL